MAARQGKGSKYLTRRGWRGPSMSPPQDKDTGGWEGPVHGSSPGERLEIFDQEGVDGTTRVPAPRIRCLPDRSVWFLSAEVVRARENVRAPKGWRGPSEPRPRIRCCQVLLVVVACKRKRGKGGTEGALRIWVGLEVTGGVREWPLTRVKEDGQWARIP
eukprot:scaffold61976_cov35-Cyclotella_meneghiniana.AAC.3